ncbi:MAG: hypothetical protein QOJ99_5259 [Bryobacterales bacterium]|jgi:hypothetical protein|nr:hypothetical protein [Bryobacterales bacterium]
MEYELTMEERARITDTRHQIQSANDALSRVDSRKIPGFSDIISCLQSADKSLRGVLRSIRPQPTKKPQV